jgi:signal transduction histidine kinase/CheY-like chemotaxis protein
MTDRERLAAERDAWVRTFDTISDALAVCDANGTMLRVNAALAALCDASPADLVGRRCSDAWFCRNQKADCLVQQAARERRPIHREISAPDSRSFALSALPVGDDSNDVVLVVHEITEERATSERLRELSQELQLANRELRATVDRLRSTQEQVVQAGKLSALGQLVAGVAHELNNPLTSVVGYAQLVQKQVVNRPELAERSQELLDDVAHILLEADRAARIVRNLLMFARRQNVARTYHDFAFLCDQVLELRSYDLRVNGIDIETSFADDLQPVFVDASQIQQALLNLVLNAEQAMSGRPTRKLVVQATAEPACGSLLVQVRDTGHGIEAANLQRVFDPFFTTRGVGEGTGLGLSIVYGIIRDHGGEIWVESRREEGTSFFVRLPSADPDGPPGRSALVATGEPGTRDFISAGLAGWGFHVRTARTMREALESLAGDDPALVVADRALVESDVLRWEETWRRRAGRSVLIAVSDRVSDDATERFFSDHARVSLGPSVDLCVLRRAVAAAAPASHPTDLPVRRSKKPSASRRPTGERSD